MQQELPDCDSPDKIAATALLSIPSPQFVTIHSRANAFAKSLVVSVLPVPAGPAGAQPSFIINAWVIVR